MDYGNGYHGNRLIRRYEMYKVEIIPGNNEKRWFWRFQLGPKGRYCKSNPYTTKTGAQRGFLSFVKNIVHFEFDEGE